MTEELDARRRDIMNGVRQIVKETDDLHRDLRAFQDRLRALEQKTADAGLPRLEFALRDAYSKSSKAGQAVVQAHVRLNQAMLPG